MSAFKGRIAILIAIVAVIIMTFAIRSGVTSSANGGQTEPPSQLRIQDLRFSVNFTASQPLKNYKLDIAPNSAFVPLPGSTANISVCAEHGGKPIKGTYTSPSSSRSEEATTLRFAVPEEPGLKRIDFTTQGCPTVSVYCLVPFHAPDAVSGTVAGVSIGKYPNPSQGTDKVREYPSRHVAPTYFVEINEQTESLKLSPIVKIGDLVCPTSKENPTRHVNFAPVDYSLIIKVEAGWQLFSARNPEIPNWRFISWFRTPAHNKRERGSSFSRHIYGDALDIIVDLNDDWRMDDLNGDRRIDMKDALVIASVFEELETTFALPWGGVGTYEYPGDESMGAAVHIDTRGFWARWGFSWMTGRQKNIVWYAPEPK